MVHRGRAKRIQEPPPRLALGALVWNSKDIVLSDLKRPEEAFATYKQALTLDPQNAYAWNNKIALLRQVGRTAEAQEAERQWDEVLQQG